jgi:hypothetical protein
MLGLDPGTPLCDPAGDIHAHGHRPRERHRGDVGVLDQRAARRAVAVHDLEDVIGHVRGCDLVQACRDRRTRRRGLHEDRVAVADRRSHLPHEGIATGKFHGVISPHTPTG